MATNSTALQISDFILSQCAIEDEAAWQDAGGRWDLSSARLWFSKRKNGFLVGEFVSFVTR